ncbi:MAG: aminotransferase class IV [Candidatus Omnitrophica bacterium]|nr:aminotransferase class IV [Candidatus Omnitrophota bacterium]
MKETAFFDGQYLPLGKVKIPVLAPGFLYGWGLFETMRCFNGRIACLRQHLLRIRHDAPKLKMKLPYSPGKLEEIIIRLAGINGFRDAYIRLNLYKSIKGASTIIIVKNYTPWPVRKYRQGFRACISEYRQDERSFLARLKSANRVLYQLALGNAGKKNYDEAVILNSRGFIAECSRSNIFLVKNKKILTPSLASGCLNGITRNAVLSLAAKIGLKTKQNLLSPSHLREADEAFLTNSLIGIMPLVSIENKRIGAGKPGSLTVLLMREYDRLLKGEGAGE